MEKRILKVWDNWEKGIGYLQEDLENPTNGFYYTNGLLGLRGELRPAPAMTTVGFSPLFVNSYCSPESASKRWVMISASFRPVTGTASIGSSPQNSEYATPAGGTPLAIAYTVPATSNRVLLVSEVHEDKDETLNSVSWNSGGAQALTKISELQSTSDVSVSMWYLIAPNTGAGTLTLTYSGAQDDTYVNIQTLNNIHQTTPLIDNDEIRSTSTSVFSIAGTTVDVAANCLTVSVFGEGDSAGTADYTNNVASRNTVLDTFEVDKIQGCVFYYVNTAADTFHPQYFIEEPVTEDILHPYLYLSVGSSPEFHAATRIYKIDMASTTFGSLEAGFQVINRNAEQPGQPAKYQGFWYWPSGPDKKPGKLTTVVSGAMSSDTWSIDTQSQSYTTTGHKGGANHYVILGSQLAKIVKTGLGRIEFLGGGNVTDNVGVSILKLDGDPQYQPTSAESHWGSTYQVGDTYTRPQALKALKNLAFPLTVQGLFSFNSSGRSGVVLEDFKNWRSRFPNIFAQNYKEGLLIPHPSGVIFYTPDNVPKNVGITANDSLKNKVPVGIEELRTGRYHGIATAGEYVYAIYQPTVSSTSALVLCASSADKEGGESGLDLFWQVLGEITLADATYPMGCYVAITGEPTIARKILFQQGTYNGNGNTAGQVIATNFAPKVVFVKAQNDSNGHAVTRWDTMSTAKNVTNNVNTDGISALGSASFTVKKTSDVNGRTNEVEKVYYWWAVGGEGIETGTYTGTGVQQIINGSSNHQPGCVMVTAMTTDDVVFKTQEMGTTASIDLSVGIQVTDAIVAIGVGTGGFTVGTNTNTNQVSVVYHYLCMRDSTHNFSHDYYTGDAADDREITLPAFNTEVYAFNPDFVLIKGNVFQEATWRIRDMPSAQSFEFGATFMQLNMIQDLNIATEQFQIGNNANVNTNAIDYYYIALKEEDTQGSWTDIPEKRPVFWTGHGSELKYLILDQKASPFRGRNDEHIVNLSAKAYMGELFFDEPMELTDIVVYTQDMLSGDRWDLSIYTNHQDTVAPTQAEYDKSARVSGSIIENGRVIRKLNLRDIYRATLKIDWTSTVTTNRVPPTIKKILLYGKPMRENTDEQ